MSSERLTTSTRLAFSLPTMAGSAMGLVLAVYLTKFYVDVVLLPAGIMAVAIAAGRAFDAITDPLMGWLSDRTRSRFGRRLPWIAVGALGNGVMFFLLVNPPPQLPEAGLATWAVAALVALFLFVTIANVPRQALAVELTLDQQERQRLFSVVAGFVAAGTIVGAVMPTLLGALGIEGERDKMFWQGALYGGAYVLANAWLLARVRERPDFHGRGHVPLVPGIRRALRNRPFRIMFISHIITAIPFVIPATLLPFFTEYVLEADSDWVGIFLLAYLSSGFLALPLWRAFARARGKRTAWLSASFVAVTGGGALFFLGPGDIAAMLGLQLYVGLQSAVWLFIGGAMHADVVDYDELQTGKRREAQFSALWSIIPKFALIPGASIPLAVMGAVGYVPNADTQTPEVQFTIQFLYALVPAMLNAIGLSIMWWYPLTEDRHAAVREAVAQHARGATATDPITGNPLPPPEERAIDEDTAWRLDYFSVAELLKIAGGRPDRVLARIWASIGLWLALAGALLAALRTTIDTLATDPGPLPSLAIIALGVAVTAALFHAARLGRAREMKRGPVPAGTIQAHVNTVRAADAQARLLATAAGGSEASGAAGSPGHHTGDPASQH